MKIDFWKFGGDSSRIWTCLILETCLFSAKKAHIRTLYDKSNLVTSSKSFFLCENWFLKDWRAQYLISYGWSVWSFYRKMDFFLHVFFSKAYSSFHNENWYKEVTLYPMDLPWKNKSVKKSFTTYCVWNCELLHMLNSYAV